MSFVPFHFASGSLHGMDDVERDLGAQLNCSVEDQNGERKKRTFCKRKELQEGQEKHVMFPPQVQTGEHSKTGILIFFTFMMIKMVAMTTNESMKNQHASNI